MCVHITLIVALEISQFGTIFSKNISNNYSSRWKITIKHGTLLINNIKVDRPKTTGYLIHN